MIIRVRKSEIGGCIRPPSSKSYTHRAMICAMMADGKSMLKDVLCSDDTNATLRACEIFGAKVSLKKGGVAIEGTGILETPDNVVDCHGSATTLRAFTALSALAPGASVLTGDDSLRSRPTGELLSALEQLGVRCRSSRENGMPPLIINGGGIRGGSVSLRGDVSSQYLSSLLLACPKARKETIITLATPLQSRPYIDMTMDVERRFGISITYEKNYGKFTILPEQSYKRCSYEVERDFSSAAPLLAAGILSGSIKLTGLIPQSKQGDKEILNILKRMGGSILSRNDGIYAQRSQLSACDIDASDVPDLVPILAVVATQAKGETKIYNASRLRIKESDRLHTITAELKKMGAKIDENEDSLLIKGPTQLNGALLSSHNDHRIAMSCIVAGIVADGVTRISGVECIKKSYPSFIEDMKNIGADIIDV